MKIKEEYVLRHMADMWVAVPIGETSLNRRDVLNLSETGAFIWERVNQGSDRDQILSDLLEEFDVSKEEAAADLDEFLEGLVELDILDMDED